MPETYDFISLDEFQQEFFPVTPIPAPPQEVHLPQNETLLHDDDARFKNITEKLLEQIHEENTGYSRPLSVIPNFWEQQRQRPVENTNGLEGAYILPDAAVRGNRVQTEEILGEKPAEKRTGRFVCALLYAVMGLFVLAILFLCFEYRLSIPENISLMLWDNYFVVAFSIVVLFLGAVLLRISLGATARRRR